MSLFLAPCFTAAVESPALICDSSAEAMTRLRHPFAVASARPTTAEPYEDPRH